MNKYQSVLLNHKLEIKLMPNFVIMDSKIVGANQVLDKNEFSTKLSKFGNTGQRQHCKVH